jgi:flagellar hook-associated protein 3 FlgL
LTDKERGYIADELQGNLDQILSLANSTDGAGGYLFSGFSTSTAPYSKTQAGAAYAGDQGQRYLQVDTSRQLPLSEPGTAIFGDIRTAPGQFNVLANSSNAGQVVATASINAPTAASLTGQNYDVRFDATATSVSVVNTTTGATVLPATPYSSPTTITFDGINVTLTNSPAAPGPGDHFTIQPGNQTIFETLTDAINALRTPIASLPAKKDLNVALTQANNNVDLSLSNVLTSRAKLGTSLKEIDALDDAGQAVGVMYKKSLSDLQDVDYAKAITELNQQQVTLQAAQQSFVKTSQLSLFNYIQ